MVGDEQPPDNARSNWMVGGLILLAAMVLTAAAAAIMVWPSENDPAPRPVSTNSPVAALEIAAIESATPRPTHLPPPTIPPLDWIRPTAAVVEIAAGLDTPISAAPEVDTIQRQLDPLTILPSRSRREVITYAIQKGDNLRTVAEKFGLEQNTIIWSNDRFYVNAMPVGLELTILPVNGTYHRAQEAQSIAEIAALYAVDPYAIIDTEYNSLFGTAPQTVLPDGLFVVVPGGTGATEPVYWDPGIVMTTDESADNGAVGTGVRTGNTASFAVGDPGSCGEQSVQGGSAPFGAPIWDRYSITQNFNWNHGGIDLAVPAGTRVYAAGGGTVIFSGWSTWGYGYTVVIAHGSTLSLYGHLNGAFVGCGQVVTAGQNIAVTGSSGRSSGPHLHFEIRGGGGAPVNPWDYQSF